MVKMGAKENDMKYLPQPVAQFIKFRSNCYFIDLKVVHLILFHGMVFDIHPNKLLRGWNGTFDVFNENGFQLLQIVYLDCKRSL